jgi:hypothetical protein
VKACKVIDQNLTYEKVSLRLSAPTPCLALAWLASVPMWAYPLPTLTRPVVCNHSMGTLRGLADGVGQCGRSLQVMPIFFESESKSSQKDSRMSFEDFRCR